MQEMANSLIDSTAQCWTCPIFDKLFAIISNTAAAAYQRLCFFSIIIFCILFAFYVLNAVWTNIKNGGEDSLFTKTIRPVFIKSLIALSLLALGLLVPRFISKITFEPVAALTLQYANAMLPSDYVAPVYQNAIDLGNNGFFNPQLRDTIIQIIETSVANFQVYIKIGIGIMEEAFSIKALLGIGALVKHIIIFYIGAFLTYKFGKLFINYSVCFMDIIVAMAMFAFFFPISVVLFIFKDAQDVPGWMKNLGSSLGGGQIKKLINAIVSVASAILTYTIIMMLIREFLDADTSQTTYEALFNFDLENSDAMQITVAGAIVLVYVAEYIADQVPKITEKIMEVFNIKQEDSLSKEMGENMLALTQIAANNAKNIVNAIVHPESVKSESKDTKDTKDKKEKK